MSEAEKADCNTCIWIQTLEINVTKLIERFDILSWFGAYLVAAV